MKKIINKVVMVVLFMVIAMLVNVDFSFATVSKCDTTAPIITMSEKDGSTVEPGTQLTMTVTDMESKVTSLKYNWIGSKEKELIPNEKEPANICKVTIPKIGSVDGTYKFTVTAINKVGKETKETYTYYVKTSGETDNDNGSEDKKPEEDKESEKETKAPTISVSKADGSKVKPGDRVIVTIEDESGLKNITYSWNNEEENEPLENEDKIFNKYEITMGQFPKTNDTYVLKISATDINGNTTGVKEYSYDIVYVDDTAPIVTMSEPDGSVLEAGTRLTMVVKDMETKVTYLKYNWIGSAEKELIPNEKEPANICTVYIPRIGSIAGTYKFTVTAENEQGKEITETYTYYVRDENEEIDNEKPTVSASPKSGSTIEAQATIELTAKDNEELKSLTYAWNSENEIPKAISGTTDIVKLTAPNTAGTHKLKVIVVDAANNSTTETFTYTIKEKEIKDEEKPTVTVKPNGGNVDPNEPIDIIGKDNEGLEEITYHWDDEEPVTKYVGGTTATVETEAPSEPGEYTLYVTVEDEAGNKVEDEIDFIVGDDEAPTISVNPKDGSTVVGGKVVKATLKDNVELKKVTYNWQGEDKETKTLSGTSKTIDLPALPDEEGTYKVTITVEDNNENVTTKTYTYYIKDEDKGEEPTVDADPDGGTLEYGDKITVTADDDGEIEYVEYYWDDDDDDTTKKYDDKFTVKVPSKEGKHYLYVRAMDDDDNLCDYERFTYNIEENKYPGNPDIIGQVNTNVRVLRVEIRNADDKIRFEPEEEILYYVDYYNGTSSKATNVKVEVDLPTYLEADEASDNGKITTKKITWNIGTLDSKEYGRVSFVAHYTTDKYNERIITVPAKIYSGSSLKDTSTTRNMIFCEGASGTGNHQAYCVGYPDGTFLPEGKITRAELASMIANIEGLTSTSYRGQFADVTNHWAAKYIQAVLDKGYMKPSGYSKFGAQDYATRADLAYAIAAILEVEDLEPIFISSTDVKYSDARCAIEQLLRLGIMDGYSDGTSKPNSNITRAEAVTIINNYLFRGELYTKGYNYSYNFDKNYNHGGNGYILKFTDLSTTHWAYGHIMEATNNHRYQRVMDGNEEML